MGSVIYYIFLWFFTKVYFVPFTLLYLVTVPFDRERKALHMASRVWALAIFRLCPGWRIRTEGFDRIDRSRPYVVVVNHQSMLDIPLMYVLPLKFKWVSKKEVLKWPFFGWVLRMHGDITIERGSPRSAKNMMTEAGERLSRGTSIIIFPEGTRSKDGSVGRFREGAFKLAQNAGVDILPVVSEGTGCALDGWKIRKPHTLCVKALDVIPAAKVASSDAKSLAAELNESMRIEHEKLRERKISSEL